MEQIDLCRQKMGAERLWGAQVPGPEAGKKGCSAGKVGVMALSGIGEPSLVKGKAMQGAATARRIRPLQVGKEHQNVWSGVASAGC